MAHSLWDALDFGMRVGSIHDIRYGRERYLIMAYVRWDIDRIANVRELLKSDRSLWFARIPRDIVNLILDLVPNHFADACDDWTHCKNVNYLTGNVDEIILSGHVAHPPSTRRSWTYYRRNGLKHRDDGPAEIHMGENHEHLEWIRNGMFVTDRPCKRFIDVGSIMHYYWSLASPGTTMERQRRAICCTFEIDCERLNYGRTREEWEREWRRCRDTDPWPIPEWYTGPR